MSENQQIPPAYIAIMEIMLQGIANEMKPQTSDANRVNELGASLTADLAAKTHEEILEKVVRWTAQIANSAPLNLLADKVAEASFGVWMEPYE